jgi:Uma2 family endonuclease
MSTLMRIPEGKIVLTYEDYVLLPNDRNRYEILEGELTVTPAPSTKHQTASVNLLVLLSQYIKERDLGKLFHAPIDLVLESTSVLQPDLLFVSKARQDIITERAIEGAPDLVIEILSPTTEVRDRLEKRLAYQRLPSLKEYVLVAQDKLAVEVFRRDPDGWEIESYRAGDTVRLTSIGFTVAVNDVYLDVTQALRNAQSG